MRLEGMEFLQKQLKRAPDVAKKLSAEAVGLSTIQLAQRTRAITPVGPTGNLQRSIRWTHTDGHLTGWVGVDKDSPARKYWFMVEFGTVHAAAQPFLRPAAESYRDTFTSHMRNVGPAIEHELGE